MLLQLRPMAYKNYLALPIFGPIMEEFTSWSYQRGYTLKTLHQKLKHVRKIEKHFAEQGIQDLKELTHSSFETAWQHYRLSRDLAGTIRQIERFLDETRSLQPIDPSPKTLVILEVESYAEYLNDIRGLGTSRIQSNSSYIREFLEYVDYNANPKAIETLTSKDIERFIGICSARMNRYSLQHVASYLRSFLRFKYEQNVLATPLHTMIDTPRTYRLEKLPRALDWETINKLLLSIDRKNPHGLRDYVMLYLMATYGLRASEITSLTLDHIDWKFGKIRVPQKKTNSQLCLPIIDAAGEIIIKYLKHGRPMTKYRELFLRIRAPHGPLKPTAIHDVLESRIRLSGLEIKYTGTHCLRHSYAVHLLRQGSSLKSIGDLLGHRDAESTCVYLRLAIDDLREVALPVPKGGENDIPQNIKLGDYSVAQKRKITTLKIRPPYSFQSFLANDIRDYLHLKRSLGREFRSEARTLYSFDAFLSQFYSKSADLCPEMFNEWCKSLYHLSPTVRRRRMYVVHNLCLYRRRSYPKTFIPDVLTFPKEDQPIIPYIFSESDAARLMSAAKALQPCQYLPLRPQTMRIAILLLYTTGLRRGELLRLKLGDFDSKKATLLIENTKFHKSRIVPLSLSVACELNKYLSLRCKSGLPMEVTSPLILNSRDNKPYTGTGFSRNFSVLCIALNIYTKDGKTPRIHDTRHAFACRALQRWYQQGKNVQVKLPLLSTYMGHVSIVSTHYYLQFIEEIRSQSSARFYEHFGKIIAEKKLRGTSTIGGGER